MLSSQAAAPAEPVPPATPALRFQAHVVLEGAQPLLRECGGEGRRRQAAEADKGVGEVLVVELARRHARGLEQVRDHLGRR